MLSQNRDTNALHQLLVFQGTQLQNLVATQTMERNNAVHSLERLQTGHKSHRA